MGFEVPRELIGEKSSELLMSNFGSYSEDTRELPEGGELLWRSLWSSSKPPRGVPSRGSLEAPKVLNLGVPENLT